MSSLSYHFRAASWNAAQKINRTGPIVAACKETSEWCPTGTTYGMDEQLLIPLPLDHTADAVYSRTYVDNAAVAAAARRARLAIEASQPVQAGDKTLLQSIGATAQMLGHATDAAHHFVLVSSM